MNIDKSMIPSFEDMLCPTVQALQELSGKATVDELNQKALQLMAISPDLTVLPHTAQGSDRRTEVEYRMAWARTYLKQFGLLCNPTRGVWQFTDVYDPENIQEINPSLIVKTVRQRRIENFKEDSKTLSPTEKAKAFERFALSALENYAKNIGKLIDIESHGVEYDAVMPLGIRSSNLKTYIAIKLSLNPERFLTTAKEIPTSEQFLIIIGDTLSEHDKRNTENIIHASCQCPILIWDYNDLVSETGSEIDSALYLDEPKKALVADALCNTPNLEEKAKIKELRIRRL